MGILTTAKRYFKEYKRLLDSISEEDVIAILKGVGGELTAGELSQYSHLSLLQAERKLNLLYSKGILETSFDYENKNHSFFLKSPASFLHINPKLPEPKLTKNSLSDAEVIVEAVKLKGQITAPVLCVRAEVALETATDKLDGLCKRGIFELTINDRGAPIYILKNMDTFQALIDTPSAS